MSPKRLRRVTRMLITQSFICPLCKEYCGPKEADIDHIIPQTKGGGQGENLQAVHMVCNRIKGATTENYSAAYYRQEKTKWLASAKKAGFDFEGVGSKKRIKLRQTYLK